MPIELTMPKLGESVVEGTINRWLKQPGEHVEQYEALLEVTTDKVDTEVPAPSAGVLREILVPEGETVRVGTAIALLDAPGEETPQLAAVAREPLSQSQPSNGAMQNSVASFVSPVVARLAAEHQIDLASIPGTGTGGRVTKKDVQQWIEQQSMRPAPAAPSQVPQAPIQTQAIEQPVARAQISEEDQLIPLSPMRRAIAEHMERSVRTAPHVTSVLEVDVGAIALHRAANRESFARQGVNLTFTAYFAQAACIALRAVPLVNAMYTPEGVVKHAHVHLGIAAALDDGLLVPVIRDADEKSLLGLARALNDLTNRARMRRLQPDETQGGTFTLTNHGVSGSLFATPIINQPQGAILGVGAIQKRAVVISQHGSDAIAIRPMCYLSLTFDHRLIDGATADAFLMATKRALEQYS